MSWPNDADGDVFRRLEEGGLDLSIPCLINFEIDFEPWPPAPEAVAILTQAYPDVTLQEPEEEGAGYARLQIHAVPSYELVIGIQQHLTHLMAPFQGGCNVWDLTPL